jgi:hypothetical protein
LVERQFSIAAWHLGVKISGGRKRRQPVGCT